jgi:glycosyltransferase involved in cell wall biosynthesis
MKKVCFFLYNLDPGGLETYLLRFLRFKKDGIIPAIICKSGNTGQLYADYQKLGVEVITIQSGYYNVIAWYSIYKVLKKGNFDSVCDLTSNFAGIYVFLARLAGIKRRMSYYGQGSDHFRKTWFNNLYNNFVNKLVYWHSSEIVLNSSTALEYYFSYRKKDDSRFKVIFNGVDTSIFSEEKEFAIRRSLGIPDDGFVIGHSGRLDEKKNHEAILKLAQELRDYKDIYFIICGKDTQLLNERIQSLGLSSVFFALGYRADVHLILRNMDIFFFPSYTEGQPNSLIEALISGLSIIASNIQPIKETIPESLWGQLVPPDDLEGAKQKVLEVYKNRELMAPLNYRKWAIASFDATLRFGEFYDCL